MDEQPKRRWFRFRLSTVLILTAIVAWGMATQPEVNHGSERYPIDFSAPGMGLSVTTNSVPGTLDNLGLLDVDNICVVASWRDQVALYEQWFTLAPKSVLWPALALAAFLAWKATWSMVERRRNRTA